MSEGYKPAITWIASYPKSGNTEVRFKMRAYEDPDKFTSLKSEKQHGLQDCLVRFTEMVSAVPFDEMTADEVFAVRPAAIAAMARAYGGRPTVKTHSACVALGPHPIQIPLALSARVIYIMRDPRDVVASYSAHYGHTFDQTIERMADPGNCTTLDAFSLPRQLISSWSINVQSWTRSVLPIEQFVTSFEQLRADPEAILSGIVGFVTSKPADPGRVRAACELTTLENLREMEAEAAPDELAWRPERMETFFRRGEAGGYKDELTPEQVARVEADHGAVMRHFGYLEGN